jgi:F-type H+-transporting ATPase subunit epsilon
MPKDTSNPMSSSTPEHKIKVKIVTPEKEILKDVYDEVTVPTTTGEITILPNHASLVSELKPGELKLKKDGRLIALAVSGGFVEVRPGSKVVILANTAEKAELIDLEKAETARQRAKQALAEKQHDENVDYAKLQALLEKEMARIRVAKKYKRHQTLPHLDK